MKELTMEMLASAQTTIPIYSSTRRGTWHQALRLLTLAVLSLTISACGGGNDSPQTAQQVVAQLVQQGYLKASNTTTGDSFGYSVALAGDTLAVGAIDEASASGAVYVFTRTGNDWTQKAYVKSSNTERFDLFGSSIALAGDTLAVGATGEASNATGINGNQADNNAPDSGAAYVLSLQ
jgi:hypothetical protein